MTVCTRFGAALYLIHRNAVARNPPDIFRGRNASVATSDCSKGFVSDPNPPVTRNRVSRPSTTIAANRAQSAYLTARFSIYRYLGTLNLFICETRCLLSKQKPTVSRPVSLLAPHHPSDHIRVAVQCLLLSSTDDPVPLYYC
jgi:hypothetical protein